MDTLTVKPSQLVEVLTEARKARLKVKVESAPGVGKSSLVSQFAQKNGNAFVDTRLSYATPTDLRGFPYRDLETNSMHFSPPADYPTEPGTVWLLDEYSCASKMVRNAALQLLLENRIGEWQCPKDTFIVLAGNRTSDRANVERAGSAEANRVCTVTLEANLDDWTEWALPSGIDVRVVAFLRYRPNLLSDFDGAKWNGEAFASPRSWEQASRIIATGTSGHVRATMLQGVVGQGPAVEFEGFLRVYEDLPSLDGILLDPSGSPLPDSPSGKYAVCAGIASKATEKNVGRALTYLARLPKEFEVFAVRMALKMKPKLGHTADAIKWVTTNKSVILGN